MLMMNPSMHEGTGEGQHTLGSVGNAPTMHEGTGEGQHTLGGVGSMRYCRE